MQYSHGEEMLRLLLHTTVLTHARKNYKREQRLWCEISIVMFCFALTFPVELSGLIGEVNENNAMPLLQAVGTRIQIIKYRLVPYQCWYVFGCALRAASRLCVLQPESDVNNVIHTHAQIRNIRRNYEGSSQYFQPLSSSSYVKFVCGSTAIEETLFSI